MYIHLHDTWPVFFLLPRINNIYQPPQEILLPHEYSDSKISTLVLIMGRGCLQQENKTKQKHLSKCWA